MTFLRRVVGRLRRMWRGDRDRFERWDRDQRLAYLEQVVEYLSWETSRQSALLRHLAAPILSELPIIRNTKASFDYQWAEIPSGAAMLDSPEFREQATGFVLEFTGLPAAWFRGKRVIDVGCGNGRYSWALCQLGAEVVSLDQSEHGLRNTAAACAGFPSHRTVKIDLLKPLPLDETADLVWSFGVLHHTGDTYRAFLNVVPLVKPGGYLYMMVYGEPRRHAIDDFIEVNEYESWRRRTMNLSLPKKLDVIRQGMKDRQFRMVGDQFVHGYFDAISPPINDLHTFEELESWLIEAGFRDITRTSPSRNLHVRAQRAIGPDPSPA